MGKYDPLGAFLQAQHTERIPMTFGDIERLLGAPLPKSKRYPAWWSNSSSNNTMTEVWLRAGFATEQVDTASEKLVFRRVKPPQPRAVTNRGGITPAGGGWIAALQAELRGTVQVAPDYDITQPTGEAWDADTA